MATIVRTANSDDVEWVLPELEEFSKFFDSKIPLYNEDYARVIVWDMITGDSHLFLVAERDGRPLGFICGFVSGHPFNPDIRTLVELLWWVKLEERGGSAGARLLNAFVDWGKSNVDWITMTLEDKSPVNDLTLTKRGFRLKERSFVLEV